MPIIDLFSKRQARLKREGKPDPYIYTEIPSKLRVQIVHIWRKAIGRSISGNPSSDIYKVLHDALCEEYGVFRLAEGQFPEQIFVNFFLQEPNVEHHLDAIELSFRAIDKFARDINYR